MTMAISYPPPFALSLLKGEMPAPSARSWFDAPKENPLGDKLTTNGGSVVGCLGESL